MTGAAIPAQRFPRRANCIFHHGVDSDALADWKLLPARPDWAKGFDWTPVKRRRRRR